MLKALPSHESAHPNHRWRHLFQTRQHQLVPGTAKYLIRVMLPAICLLLVAALHWYRVEFRDQSQWKGGGFAMFSTVDSPAARTLRCYLLTAEGDVPVEPPSRLNKWISEVRVAPAEETMPIIAQRLMEATWVRGGYRWRSIQQRVGAAETAGGAPGGSSEIPGGLTALAVGESLPSNAEVVPVQGVRLELWRYTFDAQQTALVNQRLMKYVHRIDTQEEPLVP